MKNLRNSIQKAINPLAPAREAVKKVGAGVASYVKQDRMIQQTAMQKVAQDQKQLVQAVGNRTATRSPYGANEYAGQVRNEAKKMRQEKGLTVLSSIKQQFGR